LNKIKHSEAQFPKFLSENAKNLISRVK